MRGLRVWAWRDLVAMRSDWDRSGDGGPPCWAKGAQGEGGRFPLAIRQARPSRQRTILPCVGFPPVPPKSLGRRSLAKLALKGHSGTW